MISFKYLHGPVMRRWSKAFLILFAIGLVAVSSASQGKAELNLSELVKKIQPSVVTIIAYDEKGKALKQGTGFFGYEYQAPASATG